jgi:hypothetical protein
VLLQDSASIFSGPRVTPEDLIGVDAIGIYSLYWLEWSLNVMRKNGLLTAGDPRADTIRAKTHVVGFPELDGGYALDAGSIRARIGLPGDRPVVTFIPYPYQSNPRTFWSRWIYTNPRPWLQASMILTRREFRYWSNVRHGWHDRNVVRSIREFCDANGAMLVVKYREKDPLPRWVREVADVAVADPVSWPPTILEMLAIADLAISFYSGTVLEAAFLGVPYLCIGFRDEDWYGHLNPAWAAARFDIAEGGQFNFPGVNELTTIPDVIAQLPRRRLTNFRVDPQSRSAYVAKFLGHDDGRSAARTIDLALNTARRA